MINMTTVTPKYVIISDCDRPEPAMVCQWVFNVGYCYLDRSDVKKRHDGMDGSEATSLVETTGKSPMVRFYRTEPLRTATYRDGVRRRWQHDATFFQCKLLALKVVAG